MTAKLNNVLNNVSAINRNCFVEKDYVENDDNFAVCGDGQVFPGKIRTENTMNFTVGGTTSWTAAARSH